MQKLEAKAVGGPFFHKTVCVFVLKPYLDSACNVAQETRSGIIVRIQKYSQACKSKYLNKKKEHVGHVFLKNHKDFTGVSLIGPLTREILDARISMWYPSRYLRIYYK